MLGNVLGRLFRQIRRDSSTSAQALNEARDALRIRDYAEAKAAVDRALVADPHEAKAYLLRASLAKRDDRFDAAEADYRHALRLRPNSSAIRVELCAVLHRLNRFEEALAVIDEALAMESANVLANMNRGLVLKELGRFEEAEGALLSASVLDPANASISSHLASVIGDQGRLTEARELLTQVLVNDKGNLDAHWALAIIELALGNFLSGWEHYDYRLKRRHFDVRPRNLPWWQPGLGRSGPLLVLAEQALGDEIMFASCFADLLGEVNECHIECDPRLGVLFSRSFPKARITATRDPKSPEVPATHGAVAQLAAGSLPRYFRRRLDQFPRHRGYLRTSPERVSYWRENVTALGSGLNVGLSWVGGSHKTRRALRSLTLQELEPVLRVPGVSWVSLQYTRCEEEIDALARATGIRVHHWPDAIADYDETASLVDALDLVITVTTAIVHLSGALGKPVWVLVPAAPEWRYMQSGSRMPWYPSARIFRQSMLRVWDPVVEAVRAELSALVITKKVEESS